VALPAGSRIGPYQVLAPVGAGGMGEVYRARDSRIGREVAVKVLADQGPGTPRSARRLEQEARLAGSLNHPNVLTVHDVGEHEGNPYLVTELLEGETLRARLRTGSLKPQEALGIALQVARGLAAAHGKGIVHRDLKPENLFLTREGGVKILDFGIARALPSALPAPTLSEGKPPLNTAPSSFLGTPAYMSPEQVRGRAADARSDIFSLGGVLHEMLTGQRPFERDTEIATGAAILRDDPPPLPHRTPAADAKIVARCLAKRPDDRFQSARDLVGALERVQPRPRVRTAWSIAGIAAALAVIVAVRPRPAPLPPGRLVVAVADVANATGDAGLDGLSLLLGTALEQSRRISLLGRSRMLETLRDAGRPLPARIDESLARFAAIKAQANALLLPAVRNLGGDYEVELRAVDLAHNDPLFTTRERAAGKSAILDALDRVSDRVRKELQEDAKDAAQPRVRVAQVVPADPEAWRHYADGRRLASEGRNMEAMGEYQRALAVDEDFPLAHLELAEVDEYSDVEAKEKHLDAALRGIDRLPPKERELVQATRARLKGRLQEAIELYDRAIAAWPQDPRLSVGAAYLYTEYLADGEGGRPHLERALTLAELDHRTAIKYFLLLGRLDEALVRARRFTEESPGRFSFENLSIVHRVRAETAESMAAARRALSFGGGPPSGGLFWSFVEGDSIGELEDQWNEAGQRKWELLALRGRRRDAWRALEALAPPEGSPARGFHHARLMDYRWGDGKPDLIWAEAVAQLTLGSQTAMCAPIQLAALGDLERAQRIMNLFAGEDPRWLCKRLYRHLREWKQGDREAAIRGLRSLWMPEATFHLGEVLADSGRHEEAAQQFRAFRLWPEWDNNWGAISFAYPVSLYLEAVSLERLGQREQARQLVDRLLAMWNRADPELPTLRAARALRSRLVQ